jgi:hypothetical protein
MEDKEQSALSLGTKLFLAFLVIATAGLSILVLKLSDDNRVLRAYVQKLEGAVTQGGLIPGDLVEPITLLDADDQPFDLEFSDDAPPTLILLTSDACDSCDATIPVWEGAVAEAGPFEPDELRIVCFRAGAQGEALRDSGTPLWTCYTTPPGREGWLRRIPVTPSAILLDPRGRVLARWYGPMSDARAPEMRMAIADILDH